jgi:uncharacterized membrane protein
MNRISFAFRLLGAFVATSLVSLPSYAQTYTIADLGVLPGGSFSFAYDINNVGDIVGAAGNPANAGNRDPVLWRNGVIRALPMPPPNAYGSAYSINDTGQIVGQLSNGGIRWDDQVPTVLPSLGNGGGTAVVGINNNGVAVGSLIGSSGDNTAAIWNGNTPVELPYRSGGFQSGGMLINNNGVVVGLANDSVDFNLRPTVWPGPGLLKHLAGTTGTPETRGINDAGVIVGYSISGGQGRAIFWVQGSALALPNLPGTVDSEANAINNAGDVVGASRIGSGQAPQRPTLWKAGVPIDLFTASDASTKGWTDGVARGINSLGQIVGDGQIGGQHRAFLLTPSDKCVNSDGLVDTDCDGLPDQWEKDGVKDGNGNVILDLPAMGADYLHKDIFVYVDYMERPGFPGHSHKPFQESLDLVKDPFRNAGINLHIKLAPTPLKETDALKILGDPSHCAVDTPSSRCVDKELNNLRNNSMPENYRYAFRYALFGHSFSMPKACGGRTTGISGIAPGTNILMAIPTTLKTIAWESGTFMHELGHTLGLLHGGKDDNIDYKPNYPSVMNHQWQLGLRQFGVDQRILDYSWEALQPLIEDSGLKEYAGIVLDSTSRYINYHFPLYRARPLCLSTITFQGYHPVRANQGIDWNCDGITNQSDKVKENINIDIDADCKSTPVYSTLKGNTDWDKLEFKRGDIGQAKLGITIIPTGQEIIEELSVDDLRKMDQFQQSLQNYNVSLSVDRPAQMVGKNQIKTAQFRLTNTGKMPDIYTMDVKASLPYVDFSQVPSRIPLAVGEYRDFRVSVKAPSAGLLTRILEATVTPISDNYKDSRFNRVEIRFAPLGDINMDGQVNQDDLTLLQSSINKPIIEETQHYDLNGDGKIDALDSRLLVLECTKARCAK